MTFDPHTELLGLVPAGAEAVVHVHRFLGPVSNLILVARRSSPAAAPGVPDAPPPSRS